MTDDSTVTVNEFIDFFPELTLPVQLVDSSLTRKPDDSLRIGNKIFSQFVPDSVTSLLAVKGARAQLFPIGKVTVAGGETYLFVRSFAGAKKAAAALVFDKDSFVTSLPLLGLTAGLRANDLSSAVMDNRYTLTSTRQQVAATGQVTYNKEVYVYNTEGLFTLILKESNAGSGGASAALLNPVDTLKASHKLAGDYLQDKKNLVSIRDGSKPGRLLFFIHFEKDGGNCKGELKGEMALTGAHSAKFTENNGTCAIEFSFSGNTVRLKEMEGCGSYRDIKCFFEGSYTKKTKTAVTGSKKKK
ncbi:MAG: hypothetical protein QM664_05470 [Flavihumibacter sp.]